MLMEQNGDHAANLSLLSKEKLPYINPTSPLLALFLVHDCITNVYSSIF